ncbi:PREDICTED: late cornified envelope protein 6A-like [Chrysochloris asiatica]|uniref:Late cornified envelope protein 6A-like n=1 Tax=Chrysochloris asiatica TaxID=185453 RepID=A0A9B0TA36_CHRAS|nr:PREDICTED: late cornified envelope protein 6A-like [Chrysochloris asiatica]
MPQQKQRSCEPPDAPKCFPPQYPNPSLAPCCTSCSGGSCLSSPKSQSQRTARPGRARRKPHCLRGNTIYHIKEEEC